MPPEYEPKVTYVKSFNNPYVVQVAIGSEEFLTLRQLIILRNQIDNVLDRWTK